MDACAHDTKEFCGRLELSGGRLVASLDLILPGRILPC